MVSTIGRCRTWLGKLSTKCLSSSARAGPQVIDQQDLPRSLEGLFQTSAGVSGSNCNSTENKPPFFLFFCHKSTATSKNRASQQLLSLPLKAVAMALQIVPGSSTDLVLATRRPEISQEEHEKRLKDVSHCRQRVCTACCTIAQASSANDAIRLQAEDLEKKLTYITEKVPTRIQNVMGSNAGAGSGEFHMYRQVWKCIHRLVDAFHHCLLIQCVTHLSTRRGGER